MSLCLSILCPLLNNEFLPVNVVQYKFQMRMRYFCPNLQIQLFKHTLFALHIVWHVSSLKSTRLLRLPSKLVLLWLLATPGLPSLSKNVMSSQQVFQMVTFDQHKHQTCEFSCVLRCFHAANLTVIYCGLASGNHSTVP